MKEFWLWVIIVSLILCLLFITTLGLVYNHKQIEKTKGILQRAEQLSTERKKNERSNSTMDQPSTSN